MNRKASVCGALCALLVSFFVTPCAHGQSNEAKPTSTERNIPVERTAEAPSENSDEQLVILSPFEVDASADKGYQGKTTLAGNRIRTDLRDLGSSISVITSGFLRDTNSKNAEQLLTYTTSTEVAGQGGNFLGQGDGPFVTSSALNKPIANTRVRGLAEADNTRDFFLSDIPWDTYNVSRVELQRGPNSVLFGIGSPAGIVNSGLNEAEFKDLFKVENQIGSYGTVRFSGDFNKELIKKELALRVDVLDDDTQFRQDPAYRKDKRIFAAAKWNPAALNAGSAHTSFRVNFESGKVDSNMPRYTPPIDTITPWFSGMGKSTYVGSTLNNGVPNAYIGPIGNRVYDGVVTTFNDGTQGISYPSKIQGNPPASVAGNNGLKGIATTDLYAKQAGLVAAGSGLWKAASLTDRNVFDFYNNLLEGPNKSEFNRFNALNAAFSQTFLDDKVGLMVSYDHQQARWGNDTSMADDGTTVTVDINRTLLDGTPNPNVGRPMVVLGGGSAGVYREKRTRDTIRGTAFGEVNFADIFGKDSGAARIFGRNSFTGLFSQESAQDQNQKGPHWYLSQDFAPNASAGNIGQASRDLILLDYVGSDLSGASNADGLHFQGIKQKLTPKNGDPIVTWNGSALTTAPLSSINSDNYSDANKTYTNAYKSKSVTDSVAVVWQGFWLDETVVPMVGIRRDSITQRGATAPALTGVGGAVNINSPAWQLGSVNDLNKGLVYQKDNGTSKTYSVVLHMPKSFANQMPGHTSASLILNQSENFKPEARRDILGNALPSATGKTKEYGVSVSTLDDRLTLKVIHFDTTVKNADISGALAGMYLIGAVEWWGGNAARAQRDNNGWQAGNYGTASNGKVVTVQPDITPGNTTYDAHLAQVLTAANVPLTTGTDSSGNPIYSQLALDTTQADYQNSINDWFAHLAPANLQGAWEFVSTADGVGNHDGNYNPASMQLTGSTRSKGWEFEAVATPVDGFDVSINASEITAQRSDLATSYGAWIVQRWRDLQGPMGDIRIWGGAANGETTRSKFRNETYAGYLFFNALQGSDVPELSKWRANFVANYTFKKGILNGANLGASYRWQQAKTIGFMSKVSTDPVTGSPIDIADLSKPVKGKSEDSVDLWLGYQMKVYRNLSWRIQFNVRNVFADDKLIPATVQPDGTVATYRIPEPRTYTLTNTFEF